MAKVYNLNVTKSTVVSPDGFHMVHQTIPSLLKAGYRLRAVSNGTTKIANAGITDYSWGTMPNVGSGGTGASVTLKQNSGLMTITGLSGLVAATDADPGSEGNYITFGGFASGGNNGTFQIAEVVSATSCKVWNNSGVAGDANNGAGGVTWQEKTIINASYTGSTWTTAAPWVLLEGQRMIKVPLNADVTTMIPGEPVTQGSGDTQRSGELLGIVFGASSGWAVIDPHDYGTWDTSTITGVKSGSAIPGTSISATPLVYVQEMVFWKSSVNNYSGSWYWGCFETVGEAALRFSALASQTDCTATVAPGGGATGGNNRFPGYNGVAPFPAIVACGTAAATSPSQSQAHSVWWQGTGNTAWANRFHVMCANAIPRPGRAADSSWSVMTSTAAFTDGYMMWSFQRTDEGDNGDVCPYLSCWPNQNIGSSAFPHMRADAQGAGAPTYGAAVSTPYSSWRGFVGRGCGVAARDLPSMFYIEDIYGSGHAMVGGNSQDLRETNHPDATPPLRRYHPRFTADGGGGLSGPNTAMVRCTKGRTRWLALFSAGSYGDTAGSKRWMVYVGRATTTSPAIYLGPWDGTTTPIW